MPEKEWIIILKHDCRILIQVVKRGSKVSAFASVLVIEKGGMKLCITRYDTAHGIAHRDIMGLKSGLLRKDWLFHLTKEEAFSYSIEDLQHNYETYIKFFLAH